MTPESTVSPARIMEVGAGFWSSRTLLTAVEFDVFTLLGKGLATADELNQTLRFQERGLRDFLDALLSLGFLERDGDGENATYRNTADTAEFLDKNKPRYVGGVLKMFSTRLFGYWRDLAIALRTGKPQNEVREGRSMFGELYSNPERLEEFLVAMRALSGEHLLIAADRLDMSRYRTLVDIGGATGQLAVAFAERHPHLQCISYDLPAVEATARRWISGSNASGRVRPVSGDFLRDPMPPADVITMSMILHDWNLETKKLLVQKAYDALAPGGALVVIEHLIDDARRRNTFGLLMSLNMAVEFGDAFDFTGVELWSWCQDAGFRRHEVVPLVGAASAVVVHK
jgi:SAM-dependent methyltransferase